MHTEQKIKPNVIGEAALHSQKEPKNSQKYIEIALKYVALAAAAAKSLQSCLTLCDPRDGSPPGSPVPGVLQAGVLEWVAIAFSNA